MIKRTLPLVMLLLAACTAPMKTEVTTKPIVGTWKLISGTLIEKGDTVVTDYTKDQSFIKIINDTHFAFLLHSIDSAGVYGSGGGKYDLINNKYTEHLEYCSDRQWEGHDFSFTITIKNDTLVQEGREEIESAGIDRLNIEKYVRLSSL